MNIREYLSANISKLGQRAMYDEIQADANNGAVSHTLDISNAKKKYKYGFIDINMDGDYIGLLAFNSAKDFEELVGAEEGYFEELEEIDVDASDVINDGSTQGIYRRIW